MAKSKALYFAALIPPTEVKDEILRLKLEMKEKYDATHALKLPAHITIVPPVWVEDTSAFEFIQVLKSIATAQPSFPVELQDFGHFGKRVLFIEVVDQDTIGQLFGKISKSLISLFPKLSESAIHPHITIATRDLSVENFQKAWKEFQSRSYNNSFSAEALFLLKHNGKSWDILAELPFRQNNLAGNQI